MNTLTNLAAIVSAIWIIEGGHNARTPYGITSIPVRSKSHAERICANTVRNNWRRWQAAGRPGCYFDFLALRYVGRQDPRGVANWARNIKRRVHPRCDCNFPSPNLRGEGGAKQRTGEGDTTPKHHEHTSYHQRPA